MEGGLTVAEGVAVFDVVMDQAGFMEALDGEGEFLDAGRKGRGGVGTEGLADGGGQVRAPAVAGTGKGFPGDDFGFPFRRTGEGG